MRKGLLTILFALMIFAVNAQTHLNYNKVIEFVFDEGIQNYKQTEQTEGEGKIVIDSQRITIDGYGNNPTMTLFILQKEKEEGTDRDMYICTMDGKNYAVAISPDLKYLTIIGVDDKFIFELKS